MKIEGLTDFLATVTRACYGAPRCTRRTVIIRMRRRLRLTSGMCGKSCTTTGAEF